MELSSSGSSDSSGNSRNDPNTMNQGAHTTRCCVAGGFLHLIGYGAERHLIETMPSNTSIWPHSKYYCNVVRFVSNATKLGCTVQSHYAVRSPRNQLCTLIAPARTANNSSNKKNMKNCAHIMCSIVIFRITSEAFYTLTHTKTILIQVEYVN